MLYHLTANYELYAYQEDEKSSRILFNLLYGAALSKADAQRTSSIIEQLLISNSSPNAFMVYIFISLLIEYYSLIAFPNAIISFCIALKCRSFPFPVSWTRALFAALQWRPILHNSEWCLSSVD